MKLQIVFAILCVFALSATSQYIDGSYIIQLKDGATEAHIEEVIQTIEDHTLSSREEMEITSTSSVLPIVFGKFNEETAEMVSALELVELVEQDQVVTIAMPYESPEEFSIDENMNYIDFDESDDRDYQVDEMEEYNTTDLESYRFSEKDRYNLDIIDNKRCIDGYFTPVSYGEGVDIYILDTGIKYDHKDFRGSRARFGGYDITAGNNGWDRQGHGTHCAGIAGGRYSGVAKKANLLSIRVLDQYGRGSKTGVIHGMIHVYRRHLSRRGHAEYRGSAMSMSLGGGYSRIENHVVNAIVWRGVTIVTASGNEDTNACHKSPGSAGLNINVGAHSYIHSGCHKPVPRFSNYGKCVHIVAPGVHVLSANYASTTSYTKKSGTSMACPHVAGTVALMLQQRPHDSPHYIKYKIQRNSINDLSSRRDHSQRLYVSPALWS